MRNYERRDKPKDSSSFRSRTEGRSCLRIQNTINWGFVPEINTAERHTDSACRKQTDGIRREMENNFRSVGTDHTLICLLQAGKKRHKRNSMLFVTEKQLYIRRNKRFIRKKSDLESVP